jgi:hypothetical protein
VFGLEYCPTNKTCTAGSDTNWVNLEVGLAFRFFTIVASRRA